MQWTPGGESADIEDNRGSSGRGGFGIGGGGIGIGGALILIVLSLIFHRNFFALLGSGGGGAPRPATAARPQQPVQETPQEHRNVEFVSFVLDDAQNTWAKLLPEQTNVPYHHAKLDLFRDAIQSGCGTAESSSGPFYCPEDEKVYIDLSFYDELRSRFGAPGDFAQAYVIAHELGHHVQKLLGIEQKAEQRMQDDPQHRNAVSVRLELQADCFAGVWGHSTAQRKIIDQSDIEAGLNAASAIGDDRLQRMAGRSVNPDSFTHGSSKGRTYWFKRGLDSGQVSDCDTFSSASRGH